MEDITACCDLKTASLTIKRILKHVLPETGLELSQQRVEAEYHGPLSRVPFNQWVKKRKFLSFIISNYLSELINFKKHSIY